MLIIEGTDLVGKTTLAKALVKDLEGHGPWVYRHQTKLPPKWDHPWSYYSHISQFVVQDRFHMSEVVYSKVCRGNNTDLDEERYRLVDAWCRLQGSVTVLLISTEGFLRKQWDKLAGGRLEMFHIDKVIAVNKRFLEIAEKPSIDLDIVFNIGPSWPDELFRRRVLSLYLKRQEITHE